MTQMKPLARVLTGAVVGTIFALALFGLLVLASQGEVKIDTSRALNAIILCAGMFAFFFAIGYEMICDAMSFIYTPKARTPYKG
ncbi:MAG TPA: hypothetical protein PLC15_02135 [Candidatus Obscuribacter sp.]|nr:hypothetical protein [Candidatus Obscuribacter sp.]MBK9282516.1 hypothetical protein [Candidatus Obscuribacter sp.]HNB14146.1 hypothetical protein [Candidatus Obscuribacter sp.]HND05097.1 hypothetical protein [Candidatus Obscuribacter sp.]HND66094.1 hypothetical protein [Candidatus Obscuribacter sp.]